MVVRWFARGDGRGGGRRIGLLAPLWLLALAIASALALLSSCETEARSTAAIWSLVILLPWLPMPVPDAFLVWTGPVVMLIWIAAGLCMLLPLPRHVDRHRTHFLVDARIAARVACALAFVASPNR